MIEKENFHQYCADQIELLFNCLRNKEFERCKQIALEHVELSRLILRTRTWSDAEAEFNVALVTGTFFKGISEYMILVDLTSDSEWPKNNSLTESIWNTLWNCKDRFDFCKSSLEHQDFYRVRQQLELLRKNFIQNFGHGLYSSPEIFILKEVCSICNVDTRRCDHISGNAYGGVICYSEAAEIEMRAVSIVTVPRDPRCRLWPWRFKDDRTITGPILTFFRVDDWLES